MPVILRPQGISDEKLTNALLLLVFLLDFSTAQKNIELHVPYPLKEARGSELNISGVDMATGQPFRNDITMLCQR